MAADFEVSLGLNTKQFQRDLLKLQQTAKSQIAQVFQGAVAGPKNAAGFGASLAAQKQLAATTAQNTAALRTNATAAANNAEAVNKIAPAAKKASAGQALLNSNTRRGSQGLINQIFLASKWVIAYGGIFALLTKVRQELGETVKQTIRFNQTQIEFERLLRGGSDALDGNARLMEGAARQATTFAFNMDEVLATMKDFKLQGRDVSEVLQLTEASLTGARIGFLGVSEVARAISAIINAMGVSAGFATEAIDIMNEVTKSSAIDFGQLATAIRIAILPAKQAGATFQELNGIIAAVSEATRKTGNEIGTALKSIFVFFRRPETVNAIRDVTAGIEGLDLEIIDAKGNVRDFLEVIGDLTINTAALSEENKLLAISALGSTRRQADILAIFERFDTVLKQTIRGLRATGKAEEDTKLATTALSAGMTQVRVQIQRTTLALQGPLITAIESATKFVTNFVAAIGTDSFAAVTKTVGVLLVLSSVLVKLAPVIRTFYRTADTAGFSIAVMGRAATTATPAIIGLKGAMLGLFTVTGVFQLAILASIIGLALYGNSVGEAERKTVAAADRIAEATEKVRQSSARLQGQLDAAAERITTLDHLADAMERLEAAGANETAVARLALIRSELAALDIAVQTSADLRKVSAEEATKAEQARLDGIDDNRLGIVNITAALEKQAANVKVFADLEKKKLEEIADARARAIRESAFSVSGTPDFSEVVDLEKRLRVIRELQTNNLALQIPLTERLKVLKEQTLEIEITRLNLLLEENSAANTLTNLLGRGNRAKGDLAIDTASIEATRLPGVNDQAVDQRLKDRRTSYDNLLKGLLDAAVELQHVLPAPIKALDDFISRGQQDLTNIEHKLLLDKAANEVLRSNNDLEQTMSDLRRRAVDDIEDSNRKLQEQEALIKLRRSGLTEDEITQTKIAELQQKIEESVIQESFARAQANQHIASAKQNTADIAAAEEGSAEFAAKSAENASNVAFWTAQVVELNKELNRLRGGLAVNEDRSIAAAQKILTSLESQILTLDAQNQGLSEQELALQKINLLHTNNDHSLQDQAREMEAILSLQAQWQSDIAEFAGFVRSNVVSAFSDVALNAKTASQAAEDLVKNIGKRVLDNALEALFSQGPFQKFFTDLGRSFASAQAGWSRMLKSEHASFFTTYRGVLDDFLRQLEEIIGSEGNISPSAGPIGPSRSGNLPSSGEIQGPLRPGETFGTDKDEDGKNKISGADIVNTALAAASILIGGSSTGAKVGAVAGAVIGAYVGGGGFSIQGAQAGLGIGATVGGLFDKPATEETKSRALLQIPTKLDLSVSELQQVNRNLVALREQLDPFALQNSFFFRERPSNGVSVQTLIVNGGLTDAFEGLTRGGLV